MANPAAEARARLLAAHPEAVVVERGRNSLKHRLADTPDGRRRYAADYWLDHHGVLRPPIAGGAPDTLDLQVAAGADDANEQDDNTGFSATEPYITIAPSPAPSLRKNAGFRFATVGIPAGSTIDVAYLSLYVVSTSYDDPCVDVVGNDVDDANNFSVEADVTSRARTGASVPWIATGIGAEFQNSPSIVSVVQEIVDRDGWASGQAMVIFIDARSSGSGNLRIRMYETASADAAKLHLEWTEGGGQTFYQSCAGTITPEGALNCQTSISPSGTLASTGDLVAVRFWEKALSGALAPAGALAAKDRKTLAGVLAFDVQGTVESQIGAGVDDGELWPNVPMWWNNTWFMELGSDIYGWWHWPGVTIPQNSVILVAKMQFRAWSGDTTACDLRIEGCDEDDSAALSSWADYVSRPKTSLVEWNGVEVWAINQWYWSADFKAIVQAIIDREGWNPGQAMQFIVKGLVPIAQARRAPGAYDGSPSWAARLYIEYMVPGGGLLSTVATRSRSLAGTLTPGGTIAKKTIPGVLAGVLTSSGILTASGGKRLGGVLTSAGVLVPRASKVLGGVLTPSGILSTGATGYKALSGALSPTGYLATKKLVEVAYKTLTGTLTSSGKLARTVTTSLAGSLASVGTVTKNTTRTMAGTLTSEGAVTGSRWQPKALAGTLSSDGTLVAKGRKTLAGVLASSGAMATTLYKFITPISLGGTLTPTGALSATRLAIQTMAGTLTSGGALATQLVIVKAIGGTLTSAGSLMVKVGKALGGMLAPTGTLRRWGRATTLAGVLSATGSLIARLLAKERRLVQLSGRVDTLIELLGSKDTLIELSGEDDTKIDVTGEF